MPKKTCRQTILARCQSLSKDSRRSANGAVYDRLIVLPEFVEAKTLFAYSNIGHEPDTQPILQLAIKSGKALILPRVDQTNQQMILCSINCLLPRPDGDLVPGYKGILEPAVDCAAADEESIDVVIVPGIAFDRQGRRLGRGAGYYDRWLTSHPRACRISVIFDEQLVNAVPVDDHDQPVDILITPTQTIRCPSR